MLRLCEDSWLLCVVVAVSELHNALCTHHQAFDSLHVGTKVYSIAQLDGMDLKRRADEPATE